MAHGGPFDFGRNDDDGHGAEGGVGLEGFEQFEAGQTRHGEVGEDDGWVFSVGCGEPGDPVGGGDGAVAVEAQQIDERMADRFVVLDHEDGGEVG